MRKPRRCLHCRKRWVPSGRALFCEVCLPDKAVEEEARRHALEEEAISSAELARLGEEKQ